MARAIYFSRDEAEVIVEILELCLIAGVPEKKDRPYVEDILKELMDAFGMEVN